MFRACAAVVFAYDNYQRGLTLQHQCGKYSSAFFKGTNQCAHKVFPFTDATFDEMFAVFTQQDQDIPSPWGMPAFEVTDMDDQASFLENFDQFKSIVTPDFSGKRVRVYLRIKNTAMRLRYLRLAFPKEKDNDANDAYLLQCPNAFNHVVLEQFRRRRLGISNRR